MIKEDFEPYSSMFKNLVIDYRETILEQIKYDVNDTKTIQCELTASHNNSYFLPHRDNHPNINPSAHIAQNGFIRTLIQRCDRQFKDAIASSKRGLRVLLRKNKLVRINHEKLD